MENRNSNQRRDNQRKSETPKRKRRVNIDKDVEVVVISNTFLRFVYDNPRISTTFDMKSYGDEEYITVGELRTMVNSNRKIFEDFTLLIAEILDDEYTLDDLLVFLGLDRKYEEYFSMTPNNNEKFVDAGDIQTFIRMSDPQRFQKILESVSDKLRNKIIETAIILFKTGKFGDYQKMQVIRNLVNEDVFLDAEDTEIDIEVQL